MIDIKKLSKNDRGKWVEYITKNERGRIKSWNDTFIFVVYHCDNRWSNYQEYTGCATRPDDLNFVQEASHE